MGEPQKPKARVRAFFGSLPSLAGGERRGGGCFDMYCDGSCKGLVGPAALTGAHELQAAVKVTPAAAKTVVFDNPSPFKSNHA
jgi:hypothetical protein